MGSEVIIVYKRHHCTARDGTMVKHQIMSESDEFTRWMNNFSFKLSFIAFLYRKSLTEQICSYFNQSARLNRQRDSLCYTCATSA